MFSSHKGYAYFPFIRSEVLKGDWDGHKLNVNYVCINELCVVDVYPHVSLSIYLYTLSAQ